MRRTSNKNSSGWEKGVPTPEHNRVQAEFLNAEFVGAFVARVLHDANDIHMVEQHLKAGDKAKFFHPEFEIDCIDVIIPVRLGSNVSDGIIHLLIEVKPQLGDDYPCAVRQIRGYNLTSRSFSAARRVVYTEKYSGSISLLDVRKMFPDISFVTRDEVLYPFQPIALSVQKPEDMK